MRFAHTIGWVSVWDENKSNGLLYPNENLMSVGMWERQRKRQLMVIFFLVAMSWIVYLLQGGVYLKLVVLHDVNYIMVATKTTICLVFLDGVWRWLNSTWEVVGGIYQWECKRTYVMNYFSKAMCWICF